MQEMSILNKCNKPKECIFIDSRIFNAKELQRSPSQKRFRLLCRNSVLIESTTSVLIWLQLYTLSK